MVASFFERQALGIMTELSDIIENSLIPQPISEKIRSLRAIENMINLAKAHVSIALPQVGTLSPLSMIAC